MFLRKFQTGLKAKKELIQKYFGDLKRDDFQPTLLQPV